MPVFLLLGIGGLPSDPDLLLLAPMDDNLSINALNKSHVQPEHLLEHILTSLSKPQSINDMHPNHGAPWRKEDDQRLAELYKRQTSIPDLMALFGRSRGGITYRLRKLNLI